MAEPIRPEDVPALKVVSIPGEVFEVFNELIIKNYSQGGTSVVHQSAVINALEDRGTPRNTVYQNGWLDVEDAYEEAGWDVKYDKPAYNESYPATFRFSAPSKPR